MGSAMGTEKVVGTAANGEGAEVGGVAVRSGTLVEAVRGGHAKDVPALLEGLGEAERKTALAELKVLRAEVRGWESKRPREAAAVRRALYVAGAGCHPGAAGAATWLGGRDLLPWRSEGAHLVLRAVAGRAPEWLADMAARLAARPSVAEHSHRVIRGLAERAGCAVPATDGYVLGWAWEFRAGSRWRRSADTPALLGRLRQDPQTPVLVVHALSMAESPDELTWTLTEAPQAHWPSAVAALVGEGVVDRSEVLDAAVSRLLRGGRPRDLRFPMDVLRLVEPTAAEFRERVPDLVGMVADAPSPIAGYAQEALAGLAEEGALPAGALAEMTAAALFRTEKKLVRAQLALVGKVLAREPDAAAGLLPAVAEVFGNEDTELQGRGLKLVGRHLSAVDDSVRRELTDQAGLLSPVHRREAVELFGASVEGGTGLPYEEILPPVPAPLPVGPPASTVEELVEELLAKGVSEDPVRFERALDGLVRHAHRDREALTSAVREAFATTEWGEPYHFAYDSHGVHSVLAGLLGTVDRSWIDARLAREPEATACPHEGLTGIRETRLWEAAALVGTDALPFLLASPTLSTGGIDPATLVERLRAYRDAGVEPAPADLAQALLRVLRGDPGAGRAAEEAWALDTPAGLRLAAWLRADAPVAADVRVLAREEDRSLMRWHVVHRLVVEFADSAVVGAEFPPAFRWLGGASEAAPRSCSHWITGGEHWASVLPADREVLAACLVPSLARSVGGGTRDSAEPLTGVAEAEGRMGRAVALALALGLGHGDADDRLRAVDALLVLASRGDLDARRVGEELAWLLAEGSVKPNRLADAARTAAATGAYGTVWAVLAAALPEALGAGQPVRGLGEVLAVAADCVERCGARGELPGLDGLASAKGSTQLVVQARRLREALGR
ncbi:DUF6493 family protein [Streptomyces sp. NPDC015130]|uniref:DUF7824 domain-containing protein n=1 Tax=Streptomyces sp. NPDC015130 TaxID=3364940 RepID=UPI0036F5DC02